MAAMYKLILVLLIVAVIHKETMATQHVVGGSQGWDESTDFDTWASGQTFKVGDTLEFKYTPGLHSAVELADASAYKSCDIGSSLKSMNGGNNVVKLDKVGTRYFACGTSGHCNAGMKVKITTVAADGTSTTPSSSSSSSSSSTPSSTSSAANAHFFASFYGIVALLVIIMLSFT